MKFKLSKTKCTECRLCQLACSAVKDGSYSLQQARIRILCSSKKKAPEIVVCRQCIHCKCIDACQYGAFKKNEKSGGVYIDIEVCQACFVCIDACPFGAVTLNPKNKLPMVCDLCGGHPFCVDLCSRRAILGMEASVDSGID